MTSFKTLAYIVCSTLASSAYAAKDTPPSFAPSPKSPTSKQGANEWVSELVSNIHLHGYAQAGYTYTHGEASDNNTFDLKRALLWADAQITDRWSVLFMHDFSSVVQEFYTDYRLTNSKALTIRFGQFKNGLTFENPLSPTNQETIDVYSEGVTYLTGCGSDPLLGVQYGRDLGISLFGETKNGKLRYEVDIMNGQGINKRDGNTEKDIIGRLEWRPIKELNFIATGQIGHGHAVATSLYNPTIHLGQNYKRNRWSVGFDYKSLPINLHAEFLEGIDGKVISRGAYITGCVPIKREVIDLVGSYDFFNFNTSLGMEQHKVVAGVQYWFYPKCRLQLQYVYKSASLKNGTFKHGANNAIMCQVQVRFN
ncbi:MAG: porin [Bacteroidaceae bacterium]|nr:porin [Bacteroidaceae bacterium]